jgi:uncharacterized protein YdaU (DUF1376 family)
MKDPAFLFYPNDYLGGTLGMTFEEKGAYIELLMVQFNRGHMSGHMIGQILGQTMDKVWMNIKAKFSIDENGLYYNERLELEQNKRKAYSESRKNNVEGINQYTKKTKKSGHMTKHMTGHTVGHMENENRNENIIINDNIFNFKNEFLKLGVESQILDDWLKVRKVKKGVNTKTSFNKIKKEIELSRLTANECIKKAVEKNWVGFESKWLNGAKTISFAPSSAEILNNPDRLKFK